MIQVERALMAELPGAGGHPRPDWKGRLRTAEIVLGLGAARARRPDSVSGRLASLSPLGGCRATTAGLLRGDDEGIFHPAARLS
jgi:hypothetical protein